MEMTYFLFQSHVHSCDQDDFRFGHYQLNQTTIEVDRLSSVPEIVVWPRETKAQPCSCGIVGSAAFKSCVRHQNYFISVLSLDLWCHMFHPVFTVVLVVQLKTLGHRDESGRMQPQIICIYFV
jgi:hypothetical protein